MSKVDELIEVVNELPPEAVDDLLEKAREWAQKPRTYSTPFRPVKLGGIAAGSDVTLEDIREVRKEMWTRTRELP